MENYSMILFIFLGAIVLLLASYLGVLWHRLFLRRQKLIKRADAYKRAIKERDQQIIQSLETLTLVTIQEQCPPTEACIRIKKLIDELEWLNERKELEIFHQMYEDIKHFAILEDYQKLSKQERFTQDSQRLALEERYNERLKKGAQELRSLLSNQKLHDQTRN